MTPQSRLVAVSVAACLAFASPFLVERLQGQAPASQAPTGQAPAAQGGQGRGDTQDVVGGGTLQQGRAGGGRGRGAAPPRTPPRNSSGRVVLMGATPSEKGVWLPTIGITAPIFVAPRSTRCRGSRGLARSSSSVEKHELEPHTRCKASGMARQFETPYGVEFLELTDEQRLYIFDIGGPHTFRTVYMDGRSHPEGRDSQLLRALHRLVGRRHAGDRHDRLQRAVLDGSARRSAHRPAAHHRALHAQRLQRHPVRATPWTIPARTPRRGRAPSTFAGRRARSCSSTCASRPTTPTS